MLTEVEVARIAQVVHGIADQFVMTAERLERMARNIKETQDINQTAEAMQEVVNCLQSSRLDLLVTVPMRELQRASKRENTD